MPVPGNKKPSYASCTYLQPDIFQSNSSIHSSDAFRGRPHAERIFRVVSWTSNAPAYYPHVLRVTSNLLRPLYLLM